LPAATSETAAPTTPNIINPELGNLIRTGDIKPGESGEATRTCTRDSCTFSGIVEMTNLPESFNAGPNGSQPLTSALVTLTPKRTETCITPVLRFEINGNTGRFTFPFAESIPIGCVFDLAVIVNLKTIHTIDSLITIADTGFKFDQSNLSVDSNNTQVVLVEYAAVLAAQPTSQAPGGAVPPVTPPAGTAPDVDAPPSTGETQPEAVACPDAQTLIDNFCAICMHCRDLQNSDGSSSCNSIEDSSTRDINHIVFNIPRFAPLSSTDQGAAIDAALADPQSTESIAIIGEHETWMGNATLCPLWKAKCLASNVALTQFGNTCQAPPTQAPIPGDGDSVYIPPDEEEEPGVTGPEEEEEEEEEPVVPDPSNTADADMLARCCDTSQTPRNSDEANLCHIVDRGSDCMQTYCFDGTTDSDTGQPKKNWIKGHDAFKGAGEFAGTDGCLAN